MSNSFVVSDIKVAEVLEIVLNQPMLVFHDEDGDKYAFTRVPNMNRMYAIATNIVKKFNL